MYTPKFIPYIDQFHQRPMGMVSRLESINKPFIRKIYDLVGILLLSALIGSSVYESVDLINKKIESYQERSRTEIQESARNYLNYLQNN